MLCDNEIFLDWVAEAMDELSEMVTLLDPRDPQLDIIHTQMVIVSGKMLKAFMRNGNERILLQIDHMHDLMRKVRSKQNATAM